MLEQVTLNKIRQLKLHGFVEALSEIEKNDALHSLNFFEGIGLLVDREVDCRTTKRLVRLIKQAKLRYPNAMVEDINYQHKRAIKPEDFRWMVSGSWLAKNQNIILVGPTGIGKTYLASACGQLACRQGHITRYFRLSKLLETLRIAHADGSYPKLLNNLLKAKCIIIDDWGIDPISPERRSDLLELIDDQYEHRSIIITSQLPVEHWHDYIGDNTIADAILDRIIHQAKTFKFDGESMRKTIDPN